MTEAIGWCSSVILIATILQQLRKQWAEGSSKGVSLWLYLGQVAAELGFCVYAAILRNWVFFATNLILLASNAVGLWIVRTHRKIAERERAQGVPSQAA